MKKKTMFWIVVAVALLCAAALFLGNNGNTEEPKPTELKKDPDMYTWEEYQALSLEDQDAFFEWFGSVEAFENWMEAVKPEEPTVVIQDWDKPEKLPSDYTWEEYLELSPEEKEAFFQWFDSEEAYEAWKESVKPEETAPPAEFVKEPDRDPADYTWEEYEEMSAREQDEFYQCFDSMEAFEAWLESVMPEETTEPLLMWDRPGKQPDTYTWEEYQELSPEYQDAFFRWFISKGAFEAWMNKAQSAQETTPVLKWDKPGKEPSEYTWEEYQELTPEEQDAFFQWFGSVASFEAWMESVKPAETTATMLDWVDDEKLPNEYTWEEYQKLSPEEQDAFFRWFASTDAFEAWMTEAMGE